MGQTSSTSNENGPSQSSSPIDQSCPPSVHDPYGDGNPYHLTDKNGPMGQSSSPDFPPSDGYRWRKYGQKSVKGSAFARNYYKCTYPGCTVKKQVEKMTNNGKLIDHVSYKGDHTHDPPQITRLNASDQQTFRNSVINESLAHTESIVPKHDDERLIQHHPPALMPPPQQMYETHHPSAHPSMYNNPYQPTMEKEIHPHLQLPPHMTPVHPYSHVPPVQLSHQQQQQQQQHPHAMVPYSQPHLLPVPPTPPPVHTTSSAASPRLVIETNTDVDHLDDGYHWRKYGQKTVKGSPYPRSYYKCTEKGCSVKKQVEQNGNSIVNTYEGTHTHLAPGLDENGSDGKRRRPRRKDSGELPSAGKKRMPDEMDREAENAERALSMTSDQQKRIRMQNMVDELTSHDRINLNMASDVASHQFVPHNTAPVLPLINRQLMEPVPSSSMSAYPPPMQMHQTMANYYSPPMYSPHIPPPPQSATGRLSHSMEMMGPVHHHDHHHDHQQDVFAPFTLPPPNRNYTDHPQ